MVQDLDMVENPLRNQTDQVAAIGVLGFELRMMALASSRAANPRPSDDSIAVNAYITAASLHARSLTEFLVGGSRRDSDVRRRDFTPRQKPQPVQAARRLRDHYPLLHEYVAHVTWRRVSPNGPVWDYPGMANDIVDVAEAWSDHLTSINPDVGVIFQPHVTLARLALTGAA